MADAAEKSAASARKSAEAAQRGVDRAAQQFAEQPGERAHIVLDAIHAAQGLVDYWLKKLRTSRSHAMRTPITAAPFDPATEFLTRLM